MTNGVLKIATVNSRGLNRQLKRRSIFKNMSTYGIICVQETFMTENKAAEWEREWGGGFFYSTHTNFFSHGLRIIVVELEIDKEQYTVVNCYG